MLWLNIEWKSHPLISNFSLLSLWLSLEIFAFSVLMAPVECRPWGFRVGCVGGPGRACRSREGEVDRSWLLFIRTSGPFEAHHEEPLADKAALTSFRAAPSQGLKVSLQVTGQKGQTDTSKPWVGCAADFLQQHQLCRIGAGGSYPGSEAVCQG